MLGISFDPNFTFANHITVIEVRVKKRFQVLKVLAGTLWGHSKETLIATYKAILQPLYTYEASIWFPNTSTNIDNSSASKMRPRG